MPQDGRTRITVDGSAVDARVSTLPSLHGEKVVIRLLARGRRRAAAGRRRPRRRTSSPTCAGRCRPAGPGAHHRPDRQRQDQHALRRAAARSTRPTATSSRSRTRSRCSSPGITQVQVQRAHRPDLRRGLRVDAAPGPRRRPGRRGPRHRDRRAGAAGVADRPPRAHHAAHQQRRLRDHPAGRHGRRAVPGRLVADRRGRASGWSAEPCRRAWSPTSRPGLLPCSASTPHGSSGARPMRGGAAPTAAAPATAAARASSRCCVVDHDLRRVLVHEPTEAGSPRRSPATSGCGRRPSGWRWPVTPPSTRSRGSARATDVLARIVDGRPSSAASSTASSCAEPPDGVGGTPAGAPGWPRAAGPSPRGEHGEQPAGIAVARLPAHQTLPLEPVDEPGQSAAGQQHPLGQLRHPQPALRRLDELDQHVVRRQRQPLLREQVGLEPTGERARAPAGTDARRASAARSGPPTDA